MLLKNIIAESFIQKPRYLSEAYYRGFARIPLTKTVFGKNELEFKMVQRTTEGCYMMLTEALWGGTQNPIDMLSEIESAMPRNALVCMRAFERCGESRKVFIPSVKNMSNSVIWSAEDYSRRKFALTIKKKCLPDGKAIDWWLCTRANGRSYYVDSAGKIRDCKNSSITRAICPVIFVEDDV